MVKTDELEHYLNTLLNVSKFKDYAPNGLQVEGRKSICKIVTGVTACQALLDAAIELGADAVLVHHGYFWRGDNPVVRGMHQRRLASLLKNDLNLFAYHLPLDAHPELGNNAQLAKRLGLIVETTLNEQGIGNVGVLAEPTSLETFSLKIEQVLQRKPLTVAGGDHLIQRIAWCTGGAQGYIQDALGFGVDAYLSGEISEHTTHSARENHVHYIAAGHHATERYGVQALGEHLTERFGVECKFVEIDNPA
ncbi:MAG: Nif3-like dinuclear metal center hexameric protein [Thiothrix sp.]|nr:MAG: Nif3-like dinuclear metal center hexameric protein [Thiothrix sp.]